MKKIRNIILGTFVLVVVVGNIFLTQKIVKCNDLSLNILGNIANAQEEYGNFRDGYCKGCRLYWDGGYVDGVEIICFDSAYDKYCVETGCTLGFC